MKAIRLQGFAFCGAALLAIGFYSSYGSVAPQTELVICVVLIACLGLPHGAADPLYARALFNPKSALQWILFSVIYIAIASFVVLIWWIAPIPFLVLFLSISAFHFSADLSDDASVLLRILYGGSPIVLPSMFHFESVLQIFSILVDPPTAASIAHGLRSLAFPWLLLLVISILFQVRASGRTALEAATVAGLALALPPIPAFVFYFCGMHSARHFLRTQRFANISMGTVLVTCVAPTLAVLIALAVLWQFRTSLSVDARLVQFTFITLAGLTVPHMILIEPVRFAGWDARNLPTNPLRSVFNR
jgi:beta-carotene 15,15'-dioxygenase